MSLIIFFGMAFFIFCGGVVVITLTFRHWFLEARARKLAAKTKAKSV